MAGSRPLVLQQASTADTATQESLADEAGAPATAPVAVQDRLPGMLVRGRCVARAHRRARRQQTIEGQRG